MTFPLKHWLRNRPKVDHDAFFRRVNEGRIEVNGLPFSMHSEVYSIDELAWGFEFTDELRNDYGIEIVSAIQSDVPGATIGLLNLLTAADLKYLAVAHNYAGRSVPFLLDGQELTRPFWWQAANGKRVLVWYTDTPHGVAYMEGTILGLHESADEVRSLLPAYLKSLATNPYPYGTSTFGWHGLPEGAEVTKQPYPWDKVHFRVQNTFADNSAANLTIAETVRDWNEQWAYPRLRMDTNRHFFEGIEQAYGNELQTYTGDWTDWWVDGVGSAARALGMNRRAQHAVRTGRTLHAIADHITHGSNTKTEDEIEAIYETMALFDEHTWGAANPWLDDLDQMGSGALQWERKAAFAYEADERSNRLVDSGIRSFAQVFHRTPGSDGTVIVFNPSGRSRSDRVRVFVPDSLVPSGSRVSVIDTKTDQPIAASIEPQVHQPYRAKGQWMNFVAVDVPPAGYATYELRLTDELPKTATPKHDQFLLENEHYRVEINESAGFISSIFDKAAELELVNAEAPFGFNEYIYERYGTAHGFNHLSGRVEAVDTSLFGSRSTAGNAVVLDRTCNEFEDAITLRMTAEGADWLKTTISLRRDSKQVDISNRLMKHPVLPKEGGYFAFPFAVNDANPEYEITGGVSSPDAPHVPGSSRHMFAIRNWLVGTDGNGSVAWATAEAPLVELGTIVLPYAPFPETVVNDHPDKLTVYSWVHNNIWDTNFPQSQGGEMTFHYAIRSGNEPARELGMKTAASLAQPLTGFCLTNRSIDVDRTLPPRGSFVELSSPLVDLVSVSSSREGSGLTVYLLSIAPESIQFTLASPLLTIRAATVANFLQQSPENLVVADGAASLSIAPGELVAVSLEV